METGSVAREVGGAVGVGARGHVEGGGEVLGREEGEVGVGGAVGVVEAIAFRREGRRRLDRLGGLRGGLGGLGRLRGLRRLRRLRGGLRGGLG